MKLTMKTNELKEMVGKAVKCVSNNKLIPLTSLMNFRVNDNILTITTTDATNYFSVTSEKLDCENFEFSVNADLVSKLIQKTTSDDITIKADPEKKLAAIKGNGEYQIELPLDENGNIIKFPKKERGELVDNIIIKSSTIKTVLNANKASLAVSLDSPALTCYYCGDSVITSDTYKICKTDIKVFNKPLLITANLMELLGTLSDEDINVYISSTETVFCTKKEKIYAPITEGIDTFPVEPIVNLTVGNFSSSCKVSKQNVLNVLDRLSLFVSPYDKKGIYITFTREGIMFSSKKSSGVEVVPYTESKDFMDYTCCIDVEMLKAQVSAQTDESMEVYYGSDIALKLIDKNITKIVALIDDDRTVGE